MALRRLTVVRARAVVPDAQVERLVAIGEFDLDIGARCVAPRIGQRLLDNPIRREINALGQLGDRALSYEADGRSGRLRLVDQLVELSSPG